jgi:hypothetical protein
MNSTNQETSHLKKHDLAEQSIPQGKIYETIDDLVTRTKLPKSWWYSQTRQTGPGTVPRLKVGRYLLFLPDAVDKWLDSRANPA